MLPGSQTIEKIAQTIAQDSYRSVLFDFDGTLSLIRQGWREIMIPMMVEILYDLKTGETETDLEAIVAEFVDRLTGKQTIYQMIHFCGEIQKRGRKPENPRVYKDRFNNLLSTHINHRIDGLKKGTIAPEDLMLPGTRALLDNLANRNLLLYLASGTDLIFVRKEVELLGLTHYFKDRIFGALDQHESFSKAMVIQNLLKTHAIKGTELLGFGDGYVEIENVKDVGGTAVGVASDEVRREGINTWKRDRLIEVGADLIVPEYREQDILISYLCD
jgi:phosphoglycolate phosphatase-like HAD superfamily hydrolase